MVQPAHLHVVTIKRYHCLALDSVLQAVSAPGGWFNMMEGVLYTLSVPVCEILIAKLVCFNFTKISHFLLLSRYFYNCSPRCYRVNSIILS